MTSQVDRNKAFTNVNADDDAAAEWLAKGRALSAKYFYPVEKGYNS